MLEQFSRTELLLGAEAMEKLGRAHVAVFGIGGVGGYVVEALARSGIGHFDLIDNDKVCITNLNRQIIATLDTVGRYKVQVMKERILSINPEAEVNMHQCFYLPENADSFDFKKYSYVIDAVDTVTAKIELVLRAKEADVPIISCMGTGNKINPAMLEIGDIYQTSVCPLAKVMRRELRRRNVDALKVLYSQEEPIKPTGETKEQTSRRAIPGSTSFVPPAAGLLIASEVVKDLLKYFPLLPHTV
ncbi:MAG: tRNA threonylcarbamoyladenosine dehydratase [Blautia sp.]|nr:tRNA threonylcarbamoyladenosine dehydratase [Lachnoclostridium sp.]MCM1211462.1 tRNA threonylcarbamoyladenosine dehydratase [Blautia sp.]